MSRVNCRQMLASAARHGYAVGAFNITSILQMQAVMEAAQAAEAPVIIQTSEAPARAIGPELLSAAFGVLAARLTVPAALHLDHCTDVHLCLRCIDAGYTNIMIDGSALPLEQNTEITKQVVDYARAHSDATVEGELGRVFGVEDDSRADEDPSLLCDPDEGVRFVRDTGIDLFAPAVGTAHGIYKTDHPNVDVQRVSVIREKLAEAQLETALVIHGGTGLAEDLVRRLIAAGGAKYNVSTELKYAWIDGAAAFLERKPLLYNPMKLTACQMEASREVVKKWTAILGCAGRGTADA
jgi:tagatose 1,6-diphosphate aldolase GatY/KbaY